MAKIHFAAQMAAGGEHKRVVSPLFGESGGGHSPRKFWNQRGYVVAFGELSEQFMTVSRAVKF